MNYCGSIRVFGKPRRFAVCDLKAGHGGAHYDSGMKASWDDEKTVVMEAMHKEARQ